jgi:hypothetical protein
MIKKFLKTPFCYSVILSIATIIYAVLAEPLVTTQLFSSQPITPMLLWAHRGIALLGILLPFFAAFFYTLLFYKKTMDHIFKHKSILLWVAGCFVIYIIVRAFVSLDISSIIITPWSLFYLLFLPSGVPRHYLILYLIFYPTYYGLITLGNHLAMRIIAKKDSEGIMINKFLKNIIGFTAIWIALSFLYSFAVEPALIISIAKFFYFPSLSTETSLAIIRVVTRAALWAIPFLILFLTTYFYTLFLYKKTMGLLFQTISIVLFDLILIIWSGYFFLYFLKRALLLILCYYILITFGNYVALRSLSKKIALDDYLRTM